MLVPIVDLHTNPIVLKLIYALHFNIASIER